MAVLAPGKARVSDSVATAAVARRSGKPAVRVTTIAADLRVCAREPEAEQPVVKAGQRPPARRRRMAGRAVAHTMLHAVAAYAVRRGTGELAVPVASGTRYGLMCAGEPEEGIVIEVGRRLPSATRMMAALAVP